MNLSGYGPVTNAGEITSANNALTINTLNSTHGYHFTGREDHVQGHSIVYATQYVPDPIHPTKGTTNIMAYDFGTGTITPTAYTLNSVYGCGNTEQGELQISPQGDKLSWWRYDKFLAGFNYRNGEIQTMSLDANSNTAITGPVMTKQ